MNHATSAVFLLGALLSAGSCTGKERLSIVAEVYHGLFKPGALGGKPHIKVLIRVPAGMVVDAREGMWTQLSVAPDAHTASTSPAGARSLRVVKDAEGTPRYQLRAQVLLLPDDGAEVLMKVGPAPCSRRIAATLDYERGQTKLVELALRPRPSGELEITKCKPHGVIPREPLRVK